MVCEYKLSFRTDYIAINYNTSWFFNIRLTPVFEKSHFEKSAMCIL